MGKSAEKFMALSSLGDLNNLEELFKSIGAHAARRPVWCQRCARRAPR